MIRRVIAFSAKNRAFVLLATAALVVAAFYVLKSIRLDALPDLSDTQVIIYSQVGPVARHHRGPGHLPDHHRAARRTRT